MQEKICKNNNDNNKAGKVVWKNKWQMTIPKNDSRCYFNKPCIYLKSFCWSVRNQWSRICTQTIEYELELHTCYLTPNKSINDFTFIREGFMSNSRGITRIFTEKKKKKLQFFQWQKDCLWWHWLTFRQPDERVIIRIKWIVNRQEML